MIVGAGGETEAKGDREEDREGVVHSKPRVARPVPTGLS